MCHKFLSIIWKVGGTVSVEFEDFMYIHRPYNAKRGGISVCYPKFCTSTSTEAKGHARKAGWRIDNNPSPIKQEDYRERSYVDLLLSPSEEDLKQWPYSYEFRLRVSLTSCGNLNMISRIRNTDSKPFSFSFGYHTYLSVSDISEVRIEGLETSDYLDNLSDRKRFTEQGDAITFESEVDRAYLSTEDCIAVIDHGKKRTIVIKKEGLPDAVVWNPWEKKSQVKTDDFHNDEYRRMVCIDGAAIERPIALKPGEEWTSCLELEPNERDLKREKRKQGNREIWKKVVAEETGGNENAQAEQAADVGLGNNNEKKHQRSALLTYFLESTMQAVVIGMRRG
ncbi:hypothetical protein AgCh_021093 [Apium graveolens]